MTKLPERVVGMRYELSNDQIAWFTSMGCDIEDNDDGTKKIIFPESAKLIRSTPMPGRTGALRFEDGTYVLWARDENCCQMLCAGKVEMDDEAHLLRQMGKHEPKEVSNKKELHRGWARELMMYRIMTMYQVAGAEHEFMASLPKENN